MTEKFKLIPEAHVFLMKGNDEVLLLRRFNTGFEDGKYSVIAGHIDGNEEVRAAAIREAREEAGIEIRLADIEVVGVMHRKGEDERFGFFWRRPGGMATSSTPSRTGATTCRGILSGISLTIWCRTSGGRWRTI